jgi:uncharacterized protein YkwD
MSRPFTTRNLPLRGLVAAALLSAGIAGVTPAAAAAAKQHGRRQFAIKAHTAVVVCPNADTPAVAASTRAMRAAVDCLINEQRAAHGLPAVHEQRQLQRSAQHWSNWMVSSRQFTHGSNFSARITAVGYTWQTAGENIATGFGTPNDVVTAWMASTDHCHNILDPQFANVGTGINRAPVSSVASAPATWTQDFGLKMDGQAPSQNWAPANGCPYGA